MRVRDALAVNWAFLLVLGAAIALRMIVMVAYRPVLPLTQDAYMYLERSLTLSPTGSFHPFLYPLLLRPLIATGSLVWVPVTQHLAGLAMGVLPYLLLRRLGVHPFLAALGVFPVLFDGFQLNIEHHVLSETFSQLFVVLALVVLAWDQRPHILAATGAGTFIALSALVRFPGLSVIVASTAYALLRRIGWVRLVALLLGFLIPLGIYAGWFSARTGSTGITNRNGFFLYGRVVQFSDCGELEVPKDLRVFCPRDDHEPEKKGLFTSGLPDEIRRDPSYNAKALEFSRRMILAQPEEYASAVLSDFFRYFEAGDPQTREPGTKKWVFNKSSPQNRFSSLPDRNIELIVEVDRGLADFLRRYQDVVWTYGPLLVVMMFLGVAGGFAGGRNPPGRSLGPECWLFTVAALGLLLFPPVFGVYHIRYVLPAIPLVGPAAALGVTATIGMIASRHAMSRATTPSTH
jgi:hypothetical protein